jgi:hypothetical protein
MAGKMNRDEQKQILEFIERTVTNHASSPLPPLDIEADAIIRAQFVRRAEAAYRMTMLAMEQAAQLAILQAPAPPEPRPAPLLLPGILNRLFNKRKTPVLRCEAPVAILER